MRSPTCPASASRRAHRRSRSARRRTSGRSVGASPFRLKLEIAESVLMADAPAAQQVLAQLQNGLGVDVMIDDFGTGYSSLALLKASTDERGAIRFLPALVEKRDALLALA